MSITRSMTFVVALASLLLSSFASPMDLEAAQHAGHVANSPSALIEAVRRATEVFRDVRNAAPDYGPILGCVSGPDQGAMGVHFANPALLEDDVLDKAHPEALIYEFKNGVARLVGVEFIVIADLWHVNHATQDPPVLEGQLLQFVDSPNRFGLPAFYELHVWAWRDNPNGAFADWNPRV
ncbi:MAG TPA: hypothetical protein VFB99_18690, partial [Vicinamibacterales bacterium]|nr:hypothetical protein [Vicinamibacterales bacterium]